MKHALKRCILGTQRLNKMGRGKQGVEAIERRAEIESTKHVRSGRRAGGGEGRSERRARERNQHEESGRGEKGGKKTDGVGGEERTVFPKREKLH